jgi:prephenate dehydratase
MTRVAIQGINGSYSEEAARVMLGSDVSKVECRDFEAVFVSLRSGNADHAVVPVENKIVGEIRQSVDLLRAGPYRVLERLPFRVRHVLAGTPSADPEKLRSVRSHVEALKQCGRFLAEHSQLRLVVGSDTASSIRRVVDEGDAGRAAIGSRRAAELYGAKILREDIADDIDNWTIFYLIAT